MGVYYKIVCDELRQSIDPGAINDLGIKFGEIAHPEHPFGQVAVYAMVMVWHGRMCRVIGDNLNHGQYYDYDDITESVLTGYNNYYKTDLRFTTDDDDSVVER